jgi:hypothetical protein
MIAVTRCLRVGDEAGEVNCHGFSGGSGLLAAAATGGVDLTALAELPEVLLSQVRCICEQRGEKLTSAGARSPRWRELMSTTRFGHGRSRDRDRHALGELVGLRVRHVNLLRRTITVDEVIVEVSRKDSPTSDVRHPFGVFRVTSDAVTPRRFP